MKRGVLVFSGYNQRAVMAMLREMTACEVPFYIAASSHEDPILVSNYQSKVCVIRKEKSLSVSMIKEIVVSLKEREHLDEIVILPSTEYLNRFLLRHRVEIETCGAAIPLIDESLYLRLSDKESFARICRDAGLQVPREIPVPTKFNGSVVVKPRQYFGSNNHIQGKPKLVRTEEDFQQAIQNVNLNDVFFQEYVSGRSFYLLYYISKNSHQTVRYSQENIAQQKEGGSIVAAKSAMLHKEPIADQYENLLRKINFSGLVMIEVRERAGEYVMIEANPRLWGPSQLFVDAGIPIFRRFLQDIGFDVNGENYEKIETSTRYFWFGGMGRAADISEAVDYIDGTADGFISELGDYFRQDVYLREDSLNLFYSEIKTKS